MAPGLLAVSAAPHVTPAAAVVAARVQEQPVAVLAGAPPDSLRFLRHQEVRRRSHNGPEHAVEGFPAVRP